jgi:hypothetical protein
MRKHVTWIIVVTVVTALAVAWAARADAPDFDLRQSQEEIEVMKGILRTTLSFASADLEGDLARNDWERTPIEGYYLVGQGAVFVISVPSPRGSMFYSVRGRGGASLLYPDTWTVLEDAAAADYARAVADTGAADEALAAERAAAAADAELSDEALAAERAAAAEDAERSSRGERAEGRARRPPRRVIEDLQRSEEESLKRREEEEQRRQERIAEYEAQVEVLKNRLVATLARHGDSLIQVGADEYVTIILSPGSGDGFVSLLGGSERRIPSEIISVEKTAIRDYKAGRLSIDAFDKRVLQYRN